MGAIAILMTSQVLWRADIIGMPSMLKLQMALTSGFVDLASNAFRNPSAGQVYAEKARWLERYSSRKLSCVPRIEPGWAAGSGPPGIMKK
jgi:hypothetical protein